MNRLIAAVGLGLAVVALGAVSAVALAGGHGGGPPDKVVICHASGLAGTTKYETLELPYVAVYGQAGHFYENGTPRAGHEQDYLGECRTDTGTTPTETTPTDTTPTETTPTETTPTETTPTETVPTETTPTTPAPSRCPPGTGPYAGKDGEPGNQECCPDADGNQQCDQPAAPAPQPSAPVTPPVTPQASPPAATAAPAPTATPAQKPQAPTVKKRAAPAPKRTSAVKHKQVHLTGNPKKDRCKDLGNATMRCKGIVVTLGSG